MDGPPVLMVHGLIGSLADQVPALARHGVTAFAPDLLGYGAMRGVEVARIGLGAQVDHLAAWIDQRDLDRVHLLGHSVGGAVAMLFAHAHPDRVASIMSVEGNFSLADAFWSAGVARMPLADVETMLDGFRENPAGWLARSRVAPTPAHLDAATRLLAHQPASTLQATARSVVEVTGAPAYEATVRAVFARSAPIHLIAGERSRVGWAVPDWARAAAATETVLPGGHLMMLESPDAFASTIAELARFDASARQPPL